jgi:hypothetical protein
VRGGIESTIRLPGVFMANGLDKLLENKRSVIEKKWFELTAKSYAPDTAEFLQKQSDPFANPVGGALRSGLKVMLDHLIHGMDRETIISHLDPAIRIRAAQNFTPSQATAFILSLKQILREILAKELRDSRIASEFVVLESKIDQLCLMAFDIYMQCREKIYEISANETKNRTFRAFERAGLVVEKGEGP